MLYLQSEDYLVFLPLAQQVGKAEGCDASGGIGLYVAREAEGVQLLPVEILQTDGDAGLVNPVESVGEGVDR